MRKRKNIKFNRVLEYLHITQAKLSVLTGINIRSIQTYCQGTAKPPLDKGLKIYLVLIALNQQEPQPLPAEEFNLEWLFEEEEEGTERKEMTNDK